MSEIKRVALACLLSCAVYLTPLVGPHAAFLLGEVIWNELDDALHGRGDQNIAWIATDTGVALLAQLSFFLLVYWSLRRPGCVRGISVGLSLAPAVIALNYAYMVAIPSHFLIEPDTAAERDTWLLECTAHNVWIPQIASPPSLSRGAPIWSRTSIRPINTVYLSPRVAR
jgi:hypothetical protein